MGPSAAAEAVRNHPRLDAAALQSLLLLSSSAARKKAAADLGVPAAAVDAFLDACELAVRGEGEGKDGEREGEAVEVERGEKPKRDFEL